MTQPTVCAVLLTADRQELTDRAVRCFLAQDYPGAALMILDTGARAWTPQLDFENCPRRIVVKRGSKGPSIGMLRNTANDFAASWSGIISDIFIHLDSDDLSMPTRISDQVNLLVESGKQAVGYRELLFWRQSCLDVWHKDHNRSGDQGEAWLYRNTDPKYALATSLCYHRSVWEAKPFPDAMIGSEREWLKGLDTLGASALIPVRSQLMSGTDPMMIATIHGSNTVKNQISLEAANPDGSKMWTRVPAWDNRVRSILEGA